VGVQLYAAVRGQAQRFEMKSKITQTCSVNCMRVTRRLKVSEIYSINWTRSSLMEEPPVAEGDRRFENPNGRARNSPSSRTK
jgi:hypothetical protein